MYSLFRMLHFSLETPWEKLPENVRNVSLNGLDGKKIVMSVPPDAKVKREYSEGFCCENRTRRFGRVERCRSPLPIRLNGSSIPAR
jgi:hypothetical protein